MKRNPRLYILIFALILTLLTVIFGISASAAKDKGEVISYYEDTFFVLKDYNGRPGIFKNDSPTPIYTLDIYTFQLPERDIERLKKGIIANSLEEALSLAEDYE